MAGPVLCLDIGSTFTKAVLVDASGQVAATGSLPTSLQTDVLDACDALAERLSGRRAERPRALRAARAVGAVDAGALACSSAGGGLRLAVLGYEREVTSEAGRRVGLSAGAKVVHVSAGALDREGVRALRAARPDVVLLVGGTDGGNAAVLLHNAASLARARLAAPVVIAGNRDVSPRAAQLLAATGRRCVMADNVLPQIGVVAPESARSAIREVFLRHVIGGKQLSRGPRLGRLVRAATPDAMLRAVEVLADTSATDVLVFDVGGATTDVYSVVGPAGAGGRREQVSGRLRCERTVEGDLGVRWNADGVLAAAAEESLLVSAQLGSYAAFVASEPGHLPRTQAEQALDEELACVAATVAVRRHARASGPGRPARPLDAVGLVVGSGGVLRHAQAGRALQLTASVVADVAGGWRLPRAAAVVVDSAYMLFAVGLLAGETAYAELAADLARTLVRGAPST